MIARTVVSSPGSSEPCHEGIWEGSCLSKIGPGTATAGLEYGQPLSAGVWIELLHAQWEGELRLTFERHMPSVGDSFLGFLPGSG